jgi:multidrug efflux pump subunit AcrA (membrane-fusion protein)
MTLVAPFAGTISAITLEPGELVIPGNPVGSLADTTRWVVETTDLVELDVVHVSDGQLVEITIEALPGELLRGEVSDIGRVPEINRGDVVYRVRITLDDYPDLPLRWGMTALVNIETP